MEKRYQNVDLELNNRGQYRTVNRKISHSSKVPKITIAALSILLFLSLGVICTLSVFYYNKVVSLRTLNEQHANATSILALHNDCVASELKSQYDELLVRYERQLATLKETEAKYEVLRENYNKDQKTLASSTGQDSGHCEAGWRPLGLKCYSFSKVRLNWERSRDACVEKGGHLAIITSQAEQDFLTSNIEGGHWIGLNDLETEGKWMWVNNVPLSQTGVTFWLQRTDEPDEPDNWKVEDPSGENCAYLGSKYRPYWHDYSCSNFGNFICEK